MEKGLNLYYISWSYSAIKIHCFPAYFCQGTHFSLMLKKSKRDNNTINGDLTTQIKIIGYKRKISSSKEKNKVNMLWKWHPVKRNNARNRRGDWNFLILFSVICEGYCGNKTRINSHGKAAINNTTTTKRLCYSTFSSWYMKFSSFLHTQVLLFLNPLNLRSNGLNP